jgi:hypothetical protein
VFSVLTCIQLCCHVPRCCSTKCPALVRCGGGERAQTSGAGRPKVNRQKSGKDQHSLTYRYRSQSLSSFITHGELKRGAKGREEEAKGQSLQSKCENRSGSGRRFRLETGRREVPVPTFTASSAWKEPGSHSVRAPRNLTSRGQLPNCSEHFLSRNCRAALGQTGLIVIAIPLIFRCSQFLFPSPPLVQQW